MKLMLLAALLSQTIDEQFARVKTATTTLGARVSTLEADAPEQSNSADINLADLLSDVCDLSCALETVQRAQKPIGSDYSVGGSRLVIPAGDYTISSPLVICRKLVIEGAGANNTRIFTDGEMHGIWIPTRTECVNQGYAPPGTNPLTGAAPSGAGSTIAHLSISGTGRVWNATTNPETYYVAGIMMELRATIRDIAVRGFFTQGVRISADVTRAENTVSSTVGWSWGANSNANLFVLDTVDVVGMRHTGVYMAGGDANAGRLENVNVTDACNDADQYPDLGPCACVHDFSLIGNTHVAGHIADCRGARGDRHFGVLADNPASTNTFIGQYCEVGADNGTNEHTIGDVAIGGACDWEDGPGTRIARGVISGACFPGVGGPVDSKVCLGNAAGEGVLSMEVTSSTTTPTGAQFAPVRAIRYKFATRGADAVLRRDVQNFGSYIIDETYVGQDPFRIGDTRQFNGWVPQQCTAPTTEYSLDGLAVEDKGAGLEVCRAP